MLFAVSKTYANYSVCIFFIHPVYSTRRCLSFSRCFRLFGRRDVAVDFARWNMRHGCYTNHLMEAPQLQNAELVNQVFSRYLKGI